MTVVKRQAVDRNNLNTFRISKLIDRHEGEDFFVVGSGSSLIGFDYSLLRPLNTIALNDSLKAKNFVPRYHLFSDAHLYEGNTKKGTKAVGANPSGGYKDYPYHPETEIICCKRERVRFNKDRGPNWNPVWQFDNTGSPHAIKKHDEGLFINRTVATGAIMLGWKMGASRIFLLGIDGYKLRIGDKEFYYFDGSNKPPEKRKLHGEQKTKSGDTKVVQDRHEFWNKQMLELKKYLQSKSAVYKEEFPGPGIYNLNPESTISAWQKVDRDLAISVVRAGI